MTTATKTRPSRRVTKKIPAKKAPTKKAESRPYAVKEPPATKVANTEPLSPRLSASPWSTTSSAIARSIGTTTAPPR